MSKQSDITSGFIRILTNEDDRMHEAKLLFSESN